VSAVRDQLGGGIAFPFRIGPDGRVATSGGARNVRELIEVVLRTRHGERLRLPAFGAGLDELRSEPNTPATHREIEERITRELRSWEPRAQIESVEVVADPARLEAAIASVRYRLSGARESIRIDVAVPVEG
jgi:phage baseplate assembly protein W